MRVLVCDDHRLLVDALSLVLSDNGHTVVATALEPDEAVEAARKHRPDACLLDVYFPKGNGLNAIGRIHEVSPDTKVVMLAGSISRTLVSEAIAQGAQGFVSKIKPIAAVIDALEMAHRGFLAVDPLVLQEVMSPQTHTDDPLWVLKFLTQREWEVLLCIMEGLSTQRMADQLGVHCRTCSPSSAFTRACRRPP